MIEYKVGDKVFNTIEEARQYEDTLKREHLDKNHDNFVQDFIKLTQKYQIEITANRDSHDDYLFYTQYSKTGQESPILRG